MNYIGVMRTVAVSGVLVFGALGAGAESNPNPQARMTSAGPSLDQLQQFFFQQKRGTILTFELKSGQTFVALFASYDDYYSRVWYIPQGDPGLFKERSLRLTSIRDVRRNAGEGIAPDSDMNATDAIPTSPRRGPSGGDEIPLPAETAPDRSQYEHVDAPDH